MKIPDLKPYPEYKDSGVAWLGEVPGHWDVSKVKNLPRPGYKTFHALPSSGLATSAPEARLCVTRARDAKQSFVTRGKSESNAKRSRVARRYGPLERPRLHSHAERGNEKKQMGNGVAGA